VRLVGKACWWWSSGFTSTNSPELGLRALLTEGMHELELALM